MASAAPPSQAYLDQSNQASAWAAQVTTRVLAFLVVILRIIARKISGAKFWWDDYFAFIAIVILIPEFAIEIALLLLGSGRHIEYVAMTNPGALPLYAKLSYVDELPYPVVITCIKCSIICLYIRLFGIRRWFRMTCYAFIGLSAAWGLVTFFLFVFQCRNIPEAWSAGAHTDCFDFATLFLGTNVPNVVIDFCILALPVYPIWTLQVARTKKLIINAIVALGVAEVAISIVRVATLSNLSFQDATWDNATAAIWSELEVNIAIICCCVPVLGPLLPRSVWDRTVDSSSAKKKRATQNSVHMGYIRQKEPSLDFERPLTLGDVEAKGIRQTTDIRVENQSLGGKRLAGYEDSNDYDPPHNARAAY